MFEFWLLLLTLLSFWFKHTQPLDIEISVIVIFLSTATVRPPRHHHKILFRNMRPVFGIVLGLNVLKVVGNHVDFGFASKHKGSTQIQLSLLILDFL